jgi:hypothetical protein
MNLLLAKVVVVVVVVLGGVFVWGVVGSLGFCFADVSSRVCFGCFADYSSILTK